MIKQNKGRIINIGSIASLRMTFLGSLEYTVSKHGVAGLTQHLAWELADHRITVNTVCPGAVLTPLTESGSSAEFREKFGKRLIPLGAPCTIEEIGEMVSFFASDRADIITGEMVAVDGGLLTGYGEDMRPIIRQRMEALKSGGAEALINADPGAIMNRPVQRIAITTSGGGYVPGLGSVITGAVLAASEFGWTSSAYMTASTGCSFPTAIPTVASSN